VGLPAAVGAGNRRDAVAGFAKKVANRVPRSAVPTQQRRDKKGPGAAGWLAVSSASCKFTAHWAGINPAPTKIIVGEGFTPSRPFGAALGNLEM